MENINYDLIKLLHAKMDNVWRLEKFYCEDANKAGCSKDCLNSILEDEKKHVEMLTEEIKCRIEAGKFD